MGKCWKMLRITSSCSWIVLFFPTPVICIEKNTNPQRQIQKQFLETKLLCNQGMSVHTSLSTFGSNVKYPPCIKLMSRKGEQSINHPILLTNSHTACGDFKTFTNCRTKSK